ncbi:MAG: tRNA (adenosine(37)-N6)-threonylcarbamoyltransferase complex transferase subunit TsaD [Candidatus Hydrothermales bacterium]
MFILSFETSCDETSVAVLENKKVKSHILSSHISGIDFGGVMPEFSSRTHMEIIVPSLKLALEVAEIDLKDVNIVTATQGPGLIGSLLVGFVFGKSIANSLSIPFYGVDHLEGHLFSIFINKELEFPVLSLLVSGGHTELFLIKDIDEIVYLGGTLDDAGGECLDKAARLFGFKYPGAKRLEELAERGDKNFFKFPLPQTKPFTFSFSGLKTSLIRFIEKIGENEFENLKPHIAASFQETVFTHLLDKLKEAIILLDIKDLRVSVVGGVAVNNRLRTLLRENLGEVLLPEKEFCGDNAVMIGVRAYYLFKNKKVKNEFFDPYTKYPFQIKGG